MKSISQPVAHCAVCGQIAAGWHFGAFTCRACAAFFRRSWDSKRLKECKKGEKRCAIISENGLYKCKKCRLQRCFAVGMVAEYFRIETCERVSEEFKIQDKVIPTINTFLGRPNLIIFSVRKQNHDEKQMSFIDVKYLIDKAVTILNQGAESPIHSKTALGKLALGIRYVQNSSQLPDFSTWSKFGREETLGLWEHEFLKLVKWLTYFEAFRQLPKCMQITMVKSVWAVWNRLADLASTASKVRSKFSDSEIEKMEKDTVLSDWSGVEIDMSWCSDYPIEQIRLFLDFPTQCRLDDLTRWMVELDPTDVELAYMLCQLSFYHIGNKHRGDMSEILEKFQENLADDLHKYYVEEQNRPCYSDRLMSMMKINNRIQQAVRENRTKAELAILFEIMHCESSHPEMFLDM